MTAGVTSHSVHTPVEIAPTSASAAPVGAGLLLHVSASSSQVLEVGNTAGPSTVPVAENSLSLALWTFPASPPTGNRMYVSTPGSLPSSVRKSPPSPKLLVGDASSTTASALGLNVSVDVPGVCGAKRAV